MTDSSLEELERRVGARYAEACAARTPLDAFDPTSWIDDSSAWADHTLPPGTLQFPREQWAYSPNKRTLALLAVDRLLDFDGELTDEQWITISFLMQYGGKERIA